MADRNKDACVEFARRVGAKLYPRDEKAIMTTPDAFLLTLMSQWLPLSSSVLGQVIDQIPNPAQMDQDRIKDCFKFFDNLFLTLRTNSV